MIEVSNNSDTQLKRDKLAEVIKEFEAILKPGGSITYLGTPQTEMSIYNILPERGYEIRVWPARYPDGKDYSCDMTRLAPSIEHNKPAVSLVFLLKRFQFLAATNELHSQNPFQTYDKSNYDNLIYIIPRKRKKSTQFGTALSCITLERCRFFCSQKIHSFSGHFCRTGGAYLSVRNFKEVPVHE